MRGTMSARQELNSYVTRLERRLRLRAYSRGTAVVLGAALGATIILAVTLSVMAFSDGSITVARVGLFLAITLAAAFGLAIPLQRLTRVGAARRIEEAFPGFQQRLETFVDKEKSQDPFVELLASDALDVARTVPAERVAPNTALMAWLGVGVASLGVLMWLITAKPGVVGYGAHLLWTGAHGGEAPVTDLQVSPGDATVRRHTDELITATTPGLFSPQVSLYARYQSA